MPLILIGLVGVATFGYAIDKTGEGINDAGTGLVKFALVSGVAFYIYKEFKVK